MLERSYPRTDDFVNSAIWSGATPHILENSWERLKIALLAANEDWDVWISWYEARLRGYPANLELEHERVLIAEEIWEQGPKTVNAHIKELIDKHQVPTMHGIAFDPLRERFPHFFLSYSKANESHARWFKLLLNSAGYSVFAQFSDMPPGSNFVREMQKGLAKSSRFIALLSPEYEKSDHCQAEWSAAYNADPGGTDRRLVQFLIQACELSPLAKQIVYQQLIGISAADASKAILRAVGYSGPPISPPLDWPGIVAIERMQAAAGGIFDVVPGANGLLERRANSSANLDEDNFTPEQLYGDLVREVTDFLAHTRKNKGNRACSDRLKERAAALHQQVAVEFSRCDPLAINKQLVWVLRVLAQDKADGVIPANDELEHYAGDLYGYYNRLEHRFPKLKAYREMDARDRFEAPTDQVEQAIALIYQSFGNRAISQGALSADLSEELKQAGEGIEEAKVFAGKNAPPDKALDITIESHTEAATRGLAVWSWLANSREKFAKSGKKAEDIEKAIENYEKLYKRVSPHMAEYISYLLKWFF